MSNSQEPIALGFVTVVERDDTGLAGGYLVLNATGRPLEFHCTAPVKANRAQEILYGPTLAPFLYGEQIGGALTAKSKLRPTAVFTDVEPMLELRRHIDAPLALLVPDDESSTIDFPLGRRRFRISQLFAADREPLEQRFGAGDAFDLAEPFHRIREAIDEAQKTSR